MLGDRSKDRFLNIAKWIFCLLIEYVKDVKKWKSWSYLRQIKKLQM